MKTLHVTILGTTATGKTTLAQAIEALCKQHNVDVSVSDGTDGDYDKKRDLSNLSGKIKVEVTTKQMLRINL